MRKIDIDVGYKDENPKGDWYVTITIPKHDNWEDTRVQANRVAYLVKEILKIE